MVASIYLTAIMSLNLVSRMVGSRFVKVERLHVRQLQNEAQAAKLGMWNDAEKVKRKMKEGNEKNSTVF
jgi:endonuclease YncB( thermonuclease family)